MSTSPARKRPFRTISSSSRDLAMLRIAPIDAAPLPRVHVPPSQTAGSLRVLDRSSGVEVLIYTPTFRGQFDAGHKAGRWYVRPATNVGGVPGSLAFATAREAVEAVAADRWRLRIVGTDAPAEPRRNRKPRLRVYWSPGDLSH